MNTELNILPINWKDGMAFRAKQLEHQYHVVIDRIRDATALNITSYNYGLIGGDGEKIFAESLVENTTNEKAHVSYCRAITRDGSRIEILNNLWKELNKPLIELSEDFDLSSSKHWYVLLVIDHTSSVPEGVEDPNESPRRKPYIRPAVGLALMSAEDLVRDALANAIPVARYEKTNAGLRKDNNYIPPCTRISSYENLYRKYQNYEGILNDLKDYSEKIIDKIKSKRKSSRAINELADDIYSLCEKYLDFYIEHYDEYQLLYKNHPPIKLVAFFAKLGRTLNHAMLMGYNRDHLLQYFREYAADLNVAQINQKISQVFENAYAHFDVLSSLTVIDDFLHSIHGIFENLVKLDYNELASKNVVQQDTLIIGTDQKKKSTGKTSSGGRIIIKRPGTDRNLGDDLID